MVDGWPGATVATVFVLTTLLCAASLATHGPRRERRIAAAEANHVVMGVAMVLMATPVTAELVPPAFGAVGFGLAGAGWLVVLVVARRRGEALGSAIGVDRCTAHPTHLALVDASMVVMFLAMAPAAAPAVAMPGMEPAVHAAHGAAPMGLLVVAALLALYLVAHAVATVVVVGRRTRQVSLGEPAGPVVGTPEGPAVGGVAVAPAPAVPRAVSVLAHGPVQLVGQAGMGLAMAAMLCLL
jgi:hypothetical protein